MPGPLEVAVLGAALLMPSTLHVRCNNRDRHGIHVGYTLALTSCICPGVRS